LSFSTYVFQAGKTHTRTHTKIADLGGQLQTVENECGAESRCAPQLSYAIKLPPLTLGVDCASIAD